MGSVLDYVTCPNCGSLAYNDFYYKSGEDYTWCHECGYYHSYEMVFNNGKNEYVEKVCKKPYGYYHASFIEKDNQTRGGAGGSLETEEQYNEMIKALLENDPDLESVKLSRFVDGEIILKEVYNRRKYFRMKKLQRIANV